MSSPTPEQIAKLPKWAQEHIQELERQIVVSERNLREWKDNQTPSDFFVDEYTTVGTKNEFVKRFVQTHKIAIEAKGVHIEVINRDSENGIDISWASVNRGMADVACVPTGYNQVRIIAKENMRS